jgi:hypothetical protein
MGRGLLLAYSEGTHQAAFYGFVVAAWLALLWWGIRGSNRNWRAKQRPTTPLAKFREAVGDHPVIASLAVLLIQGTTYSVIWGEPDGGGGGGGGTDCVAIDIAACPGYPADFDTYGDFGSDMPFVSDIVISGYSRDLDCDDIGFPMVMDVPDEHGFDADEDGVGCEPNEYGP